MAAMFSILKSQEKRYSFTPRLLRVSQPITRLKQFFLSRIIEWDPLESFTEMAQLLFKITQVELLLALRFLLSLGNLLLRLNIYLLVNGKKLTISRTQETCSIAFRIPLGVKCKMQLIPELT